MFREKPLAIWGGTCVCLVLLSGIAIGQAPGTPGGLRIVGLLPGPPPPPPTADLAAVTWNIQINDSSAAHARAVIAYLVNATPRPQVIVIQEGRQSQYNTYLSELQAQTGVTWSGVFRTHCPPGLWNGTACTGTEDEGVGVFTSLPLQNSGVLYFPYADAYHSARAAVRAAIDVNGVTTQVFGVHLMPGNATARYSSMATLKSTASGYASPRLIAGDFNADPDQITSSQGMGGAYVDALQLVGNGIRLTYPVPTPTMSLDYWFSDIGGKAQPLRAAIASSSGSISDHYPVTATYLVAP